MLHSRTDGNINLWVEGPSQASFNYRLKRYLHNTDKTASGQYKNIAANMQRFQLSLNETIILMTPQTIVTVRCFGFGHKTPFTA